MSTIELPEDVAARLDAEARRRGISLETLITELAEGLPLPSDGSTSGSADEISHRRRLGFVSLGSSTTGRCAREADDMLAEGFGRS